jgi:hypothetical protein
MGVGYSKERDLSIGAEEEEPSEHWNIGPF